MKARTRAITLSGIAWAFGMSVSILFLALWGHAVVVDTETLGESLSPLATSSTVVDYVADWMADEMVESDVAPDMVEPAIDYFFESSGVGQTLEQFAVEVVDAAASTDPAGATIDMAALVGPAVPEVADGLAGLGYPVTVSDVSEVVEQFDPLVIREPGSGAIVGPASPTASRLGTAALLALVALLVFGSGYVLLSDDRLGSVRSLMNRVAVGGLSFAVFLRLGSWVLDPDGGRSPVRESLSAVAGSKLALPLQVALGAALIAAGIYVGRRVLRRAGVFRSQDGRSTRPGEQPKELSGSR